MRIVCLSNLGDGPGFVVRRVVSEFPATRVVQIKTVPRVRPWHRKLRSFVQGGWLRRLEHRLYYRPYFARGFARMDELLYGSQGVPELAPLVQVASTSVNHPATARLLRSLRPDVLLVAGAPLLKPEIFELPRLAAINVHFGIAPYYRGEHTLFWPIYYRDLSRVGITIHLIDRGIDTGRMLAQGFVGVSPSDDEWIWEAKAARLAADLVVELLAGGSLEPRWQPSPGTRGRVFNFRDRRIWHDLALAVRRRRERALEGPTAPSRVINFCVEPGSTALFEPDLAAAEAR